MMTCHRLPTGEEVRVIEKIYDDEVLVEVIETGEKRSVPEEAIE